ncbi:MAG: hypothetical protein AAGH15_22735, partial [Myxococcota bacterium]
AQPELRQALLDAAPASSRIRLSRAADAPDPGERVRGDLIVEGRWSGGDVDLTLVTPQGTRLSWMGGRTNVVGDDAATSGHERLGLTRAGVGSYVLEVSRVDPASTEPIRGTVRVEALGETRTLPFELQGSRVTVGRIGVVRRWRIR